MAAAGIPTVSSCSKPGEKLSAIPEPQTPMAPAGTRWDETFLDLAGVKTAPQSTLGFKVLVFKKIKINFQKCLK